MFTEAEYLKKPSERTFSGPYVENEHALMVKSGAVRNRYMGRTLPFEPNYLNAVRLVVDSIRPTTVIEIGALEGGLTAYISDTIKLFGYKANIFAYDVVVDPSSRMSVDMATFMAMGYHLSHDEILEHLNQANENNGPMLIIHNTWSELAVEFEVFNSSMRQGDVIATMSTSIEQCHDEVMHLAEEKFSIMARLCDLFGENNISNPNGFLIKE